jgi:hypothetical protein
MATKATDSNAMMTLHMTSSRIEKSSSGIWDTALRITDRSISGNWRRKADELGTMFLRLERLIISGHPKKADKPLPIYPHLSLSLS